MAGGKPLHAHRKDVANPPFRVALGLFLDLSDTPGGVVASICLYLLEEELLGPRRRQPRCPLQGPLEVGGPLDERLTCKLELRLAIRHRLLTSGQRGLTASQGGGTLSELCLGRGGTINVSFALPAPAERDCDSTGSQARTMSLNTGMQGAVGPCRMAPGIKDGSEDDPYRYQCCGTDDVHGRSSLVTALNWARRLQFSVVERPNDPFRHYGCRLGHSSDAPVAGKELGGTRE